MGELITAPFTDWQRRRLQDWQVGARWHPFTCPNDGRSLVPMDRWVCSACDYEQEWAHAFMVEERLPGQV